jgi:hypothetical protein
VASPATCLAAAAGQQFPSSAPQGAVQGVRAPAWHAQGEGLQIYPRLGLLHCEGHPTPSTSSLA